MARPRIYQSNAERQAAYRWRRAARLEAALAVGSLERIRRLEADVAAANRRAAAATDTSANLRRQLAERAQNLTAAEGKIRHLEQLGAGIWTRFHYEPTTGQMTPARESVQHSGPNRTDRRAAERDERRRRRRGW